MSWRSGPADGSDDKGFALLEVVIVLALLLVIAAVGFISLNQHRLKEEREEVRVSLTRAALAAERYGEDNDGSYGGLETLAIDDLKKYGYRPIESVRLEVASAEDDVYCLQVHHEALDDDAWGVAVFDSSTGEVSSRDECG